MRTDIENLARRLYHSFRAAGGYAPRLRRPPAAYAFPGGVQDPRVSSLQDGAPSNPVSVA